MAFYDLAAGNCEVTDRYHIMAGNKAGIRAARRRGPKPSWEVREGFLEGGGQAGLTPLEAEVKGNYGLRELL